MSTFFSLNDFPRLSEIDHAAEAAFTRWQAAIQRIDPGDLLAEIYDLHAGNPSPEDDPLKPLVDAILSSPPCEPYASRYHHFHVAPHILEYTGKRWTALVAQAFDRVLQRELDRMDLD
jgi:hypothetical protein